MKKSIKRILGATAALALLAGAGVALGSISKDAVKVSAATAEFTLSGAEEVTVDGVTVSFAKGSGSSAPAWYDNGLRLYVSNTITITCESAITGVSFNWEQQGSKTFNTVTADVGTYTHPSSPGIGTWTGEANQIVFTCGTTSKAQLQLNTFSVNYNGGSTAELESLAVSGSFTKTEYTTAESWDPNGLTVMGHYDDGSDKNVTSKVSWSYDPASPADGVTSVVATASLSGKSASSSAQAVTVTVAHAGTESDPFTVTEAIAKAKENGTTAAGPWWTTGVISKVETWNSNFPNITYWISEDGKGGDDKSSTVECYRGKYVGNTSVTTDNYTEFVVGATVVVRGNLKNYNSNTPEYDTGNYLISIVPPSTGDIDVTFEPTTSFEIGATGSFTASTTAQNPTYTWSVDESSVISVNASTGAYEALALGVARVTVNVTSDDGDGTAFADVVVNGTYGDWYTVDEAISIAASLPSGKTSDYYIYVEGFVKEFATSLKDNDPTKPRAIDICNHNETKRIMVYTNVNPYADFIDGLSLGDAVRVRANVQNYQSTYELTSPEKLFSEYVAMSFGCEFLSLTDPICNDYDGVTNNKEALEAIWDGLEAKYDGLTTVQQSGLREPDTYNWGDSVKDAMTRYDYVVGKYQLENFIGRTPVSFDIGNYNNPISTAANTSTFIIVVTVVALISVTSIGALVIIKRRRAN